jgi:hypothetical protein
MGALIFTILAIVGFSGLTIFFFLSTFKAWDEYVAKRQTFDLSFSIFFAVCDIFYAAEVVVYVVKLINLFN